MYIEKKSVYKNKGGGGVSQLTGNHQKVHPSRTGSTFHLKQNMF